ncbi:O-antigen polymerase [Enterobacteriaceae bacterium C34A]
MFRILIYPLNTALMLTLSLLFSLLNLSWFYQQPDEKGILYLLVVICIYFFFSFAHFGIKKPKLNNLGLNSRTYYHLLLISLVGFFIEFIIYGIPLFVEGGRDNYSGLPVLHVIFYSMLVCSVVFAALYASTKSLLVCLLCVFIMAILLLSRQMIMMACIMTVTSLSLRYNVSGKSVFKFLIYGLILIFIFGVLGNIRQQLSGDYVDGYIYVVGGANANGAKLWEPLYWVWLYIASPIYNLLLNFNGYDNLGDSCNVTISYGSCSGDYLSAVFVPNTFIKYLGLDTFDIDLVMAHLNVGTGYASAARLLGLWGVVILIVFQLMFFWLGLLCTAKHIKEVYIVYFSTLSFFMLFDNLFVKGEFFFGFVLIFMVGWCTRPERRYQDN